MTLGKLSLVGKKQTLQIAFVNKKGNTVSLSPSESALSKPLLMLKRNDPKKLDNLEVEFDEAQGLPLNIREKGQTWENPAQVAHIAKQTQSRQSSDLNRSRQSLPKGDFHNPYNFIPAPPRKDDHPDLGDHHPVGHGTYHADRWSGRIAVALTLKTPLLIPDAGRATGDEHKTYPLRVDAAGKPDLPPTSIKGMLRSAYEAVTNSRLAIFEKHGERLAYRMPAKIGPIPARVEKTDAGLYLRLMATDLLGYAAKLPRYQKHGQPLDKGASQVALKYEQSRTLPKHQDAVWVMVDAKGKVTQIREREMGETSPGMEWQRGWACITGANISGKEYERIFLEDPSDRMIPVTDEMRLLWGQLIKNYQEVHQKDLEKRREKKQSPDAYFGREPRKTAWSRHVYEAQELTLGEGTLCYVEMVENQVNALLPVSISRRLYDLPPVMLLDDRLKPAVSIQSLSPADRVFGWVCQGKPSPKNAKVAYKGNLRISAVQCLSNKAIEPFHGLGLPLAILGQPKPEQTRFYIASDHHGSPLEPGIDKAEGYQDHSKTIRGRKVYPHHRALVEDYWENPTEENSAHEYRRLPATDEKICDDQNRSILGWVKPQTKFVFSIDITNLSDVELGALLWLLALPSEHYHRLGGGKPLGFGSIRLDIDWDKTELKTGQDWGVFYSSLIAAPTVEVTSDQVNDCIQKFQTALSQAYEANFTEIPFIAAFLKAAQGFNDRLPIHYPRVTAKASAESKSFSWFVDNERSGQNGGLKLPLPALVQETGLPLNPTY
jgi:CRISPR-associated protein (TIGR03986 family)